jgi:DNA helicase-2/ATP-dependent DNA helicase PcrA
LPGYAAPSLRLLAAPVASPGAGDRRPARSGNLSTPLILDAGFGGGEAISDQSPKFEEGARVDPVVADELRLLGGVSEQLEKMPAPRSASEEPIVQELERIRSAMLSGDEHKDLPALTEQWHHQSSILRQLRSAALVAKVDPGSPYFAHLRLRENGHERDLCLGKATCIERSVRIVDWRDAPISRIFYSYRQGEEFDEEIAGRERIGQVVVRRMVRIQDGILDRVQAPEGDFHADPAAPGGWRCEESAPARLSGGESAALRAWSKGEGAARRMGTDHHGLPHRADKRLPEITGLIDPDQFDLITRPSEGVLVVRGTAGSGKTTVALHRIAYLAYDDASVDGDRTLVIVFSAALRNYVAHVLPSLGLEAVRIVTYREWAVDLRRRHFPKLPTRHRNDTPGRVLRIKLHPFMGVALRRQIERIEGPRTGDQAQDDWASVLTQRPLLEAVSERHAPGVFSSRDLDRFVDYNRRRLDELYAGLAGDDDVPFELDPEDDALLLRAWQLRVGPLRGRGKAPLRLRHVAIDEVQDFSPVEVQVVLGCMERGAGITMAGDTQQHVMQHSGFTSWQEFFDHLGVKGTEVETLRISYRSSQEIVEFADSVLGDLREEEDVPITTRTGPPVEHFSFVDHGACVAFLSDVLRDLADHERMASVALLTPAPETSDAYYAGLAQSDLPRLRRVRDQDFTFRAGIEVTEIDQVKGLEFDYVILLDVDAQNYPDTSSARRLLHVGATRAIHQLWLCSVARPSPLIGSLRSR